MSLDSTLRIGDVDREHVVAVLGQHLGLAGRVLAWMQAAGAGHCVRMTDVIRAIEGPVESVPAVLLGARAPPRSTPGAHGYRAAAARATAGRAARRARRCAARTVSVAARNTSCSRVRGSNAIAGAPPSVSPASAA